MDQEAVLEGPTGTVGVAKVVDGGPPGVDARLKGLDQSRPQRLELSTPEGAGLTERMDAGPEQGLVRVDVPPPRDPLLGEQEGLDRSAAAAGQVAQRGRREPRLERLDPQPGVEVRLARLPPQKD